MTMCGSYVAGWIVVREAYRVLHVPQQYRTPKAPTA